MGFGSPAAVAAVDGVAGEIGLWDGMIPVERVGSQRVVAVVAGITLLLIVKSSQVVGLRTRVASIRTLIFSSPHPYGALGVVEMLNLGMDEMLVLLPVKCCVKALNLSILSVGKIWWFPIAEFSRKLFPKPSRNHKAAHAGRNQTRSSMATDSIVND